MLFLLSSAITKLRRKLGPKNTRPLRQSHNAMRYNTDPVPGASKRPITGKKNSTVYFGVSSKIRVLLKKGRKPTR